MLNTHPHAKVLSIDTSKAETMNGFVAFISAETLENGDEECVSRNQSELDEELFRSKVSS